MTDRETLFTYRLREAGCSLKAATSTMLALHNEVGRRSGYGHIGEIPGASVSVKQFSSIAEARKEEAKAIKQEQPKYNEKGK